MTEWINQRYGTNFTEDDLMHIKDFSLIWNVFESTTCANNFTINRIEQQLTNKDIGLDHFRDIVTYFRNR